MPSEAVAELTPATAPGPVAAPPSARLLVRFTATERWLHWVHTVGFLGMLATGLLLYLPGLTNVVASRPSLKAAHLVIVVAWLAALALVVILGNRRALRVTLAEIDRFDQDDRDWLRSGRRAPQERFNAGQKLHAVVQAGFSVLFLVSGVLLWLGERNNDLRLPGTITVHDGAMFLAMALLVGHLWLALVWPATRHAMHGIVFGTVRAEWAARHHAKWAARRPSAPRSTPPGPAAALLSSLIVLAAGVGAVALARDAVGDSAGAGVNVAQPAAAAPAAPLVEDPVQTVTGTAPAPEPGTPPLQLATQAQALEQAGDSAAAIVRYRLAVRGVPARADIRTALGVSLARAGNIEDALRQLRRATRTLPAYPDARLYLGAVLVQNERRAEGRAQLRRYLRGAGDGPGAPLARQLLDEG